MDKKAFVAILVTIVYAVITLIGVLHHEIWADEAQTWLLVKHLSIPQLINHLHNEGHPSLFYLMIMPFAKLSTNIIWQQLICWIAMCVAVFLLFFKSRFPFIVKLAIVSSSGFFYFLPVMARSYSIIPVLVFLSAILYERRKENPILYAIPLFLLANTHAIMLGFVGILTCIYLCEIYKDKTPLKSKQTIALLIMLFGMLLLFLQLHNTTSNNVFIQFKPEEVIIRTIKVFLFFFINTYNQVITEQKSILFPLIDIPVIILLISSFVIMFINLYINNKKLFLISFLGIGFQFAVYSLAYSANTYVTRIFSAFIILIFCFWILYKNNSFNNEHKLTNKKFTTILISIFFLITTYNGINFYIKDINYNYTGAKETADFIRENIDKNAKLLIDEEAFLISLAYYLKDDYKLYSVIRNRNLDYVIWDENLTKKLTSSAWLQYCLITDTKDSKLYVVRSYNDEIAPEKALTLFNKEQEKNFKLIFSSTPSIVKLEGHRIYKFIKD